MKENIKRIITLILAIALCFTLTPMSAMAVVDEGETGAAAEEQPEPTPEATEEPTAEPSAAPTPESTSSPEPEATAGPEPTPAASGEEEQSEDTEDIEHAENSVARVMYHYFDGSVAVADFSEYDPTSTHIYRVEQVADKTGVHIRANMFPGKVPLSTTSLRFRVMLDYTSNSWQWVAPEDIADEAVYDASTGIVTVPLEYRDRDITVIWYCPDSEIRPLNMNVNVTTTLDGTKNTATVSEEFQSDQNSFTVQIAEEGTEFETVTVRQNGVELQPVKVVYKNGYVSVIAPVLGGDLDITATDGSTVSNAPFARAFAAESTESVVALDSGMVTPLAVGDRWDILAATISTMLPASTNIHYAHGVGDHSPDYGFAVSIHICENPDLAMNSTTKIGNLGTADSFYDSTSGRWISNPDLASIYFLWADCLGDVDDNGRGVPQFSSGYIEEIAYHSKTGMSEYYFRIYCYSSHDGHTMQTVEGTFFASGEEETGEIKIRKTSSNTSMSSNNSNYSLSGAVYTVYDADDDTSVGKITLPSSGAGSLKNLPLGKYYLKETKAPKGYKLNKQVYNVTLNSDAVTVNVQDEPNSDPVRILLRKLNSETGSNELRGSMTLAGAEFTIKYYKENYTQASPPPNSATPERTWVVRTDSRGYAELAASYLVSGDALYYDEANQPVLPLGSISIQETKAPVGFKINNELFVRQIVMGSNNDIETYNEPVVNEDPIRGGFSISKRDFEVDGATPQGDATFANATMDVYNRNANPVDVNGTTYAAGAVCFTFTTDASGNYTSANNLLLYGDYEIVERTPPSLYTGRGTVRRSFSISTDGAIVPIDPIKNEVVRGGVRVLKMDNETNKNEPQGGGTLEGATFEIVKAGGNPVLVGGKMYNPGDVVHTMTTNAEGVAETAADLLPGGKYQVREVAPPDGYLARGVLIRSFDITTDGEIATLNTPDTAIKNDPIRGDVKGVKVAEGDGERLAGVPFEITSKTTGESHVIVTDKNGTFDSSSDWNKHSQNTNRGETAEDGIWFGELSALDDGLGALLYDDYVMTELRSAANEDKELLTFEFSVYKNSTVLDLGTLIDPYTVVPEIFTTAMDKDTTTQIAYVSETTTIVDTIYYNGVTPGEELTVEGVQMSKTTGEELIIDEAEVTAAKTFKALGVSGSVTLEFTFDSRALIGESVVTFETLKNADGEIIAEHKDIDDEGQTVTFTEPKIGTTATGKNGEKELAAADTVTIIDTVAYEGLAEYTTHTFKGVAMDYETAEPLIVNGEQVTAEWTGRIKESSGSVEVKFVFDAMGLAGKKIVIFETVEYEGVVIAEHKDIEDEGQTVTFIGPSIGTTLTGPDGAKVISIGSETRLTDTVDYENLTEGEKYKLICILMSKSTGKPLMVNGKEVRAEKEFKAMGSSGSVDVEIVFDSTALAGEDIVAFEYLSYYDVEIASHEDIEDEGQTVSFNEPKIGTTLTDKNGEKKLVVSEKTELTDTVAYENLDPSKTYTLLCVMMEQAAGGKLVIDGKEVTSEIQFSPMEATGSAEVPVTFNSTTLNGKSVVAYEYLYLDGELIASHEDIEDEAQTVSFGLLTGRGAQTGQAGLPVWALVLAVCAIAGVVVLVVVNRKRKARNNG